MNVISQMKQYARDNNVPIIQQDALDYIKRILNIYKPISILEIGTAIGYSAIEMANAYTNHHKTITTIEHREDLCDIARRNIQNAGLSDIINVVCEDAIYSMREMIRIGEAFDFIFVDAAKGQYSDYLPLYLELCHPDTIIVTDNVLFRGMVKMDLNFIPPKKYRNIVLKLRQYIKDVMDCQMLESMIVNIGDGLLISKYMKG